MAREKTNGLLGDRVRVLVADSSWMGTERVLAALHRDDRFNAVGVLPSPKEFAVALSEITPHVMIVGANSSKSANSFALLRYGLPRFPRMRAVMLLDSSTRDLVVEAFRAGARGVICRDDVPDALCKCIYAVHLGQVWANSAQLEYLLEACSRRWVLQTIVDSKGRALLSNRELDVVRCVAEGMTNREIASQLKLSGHTVKNYIFRIFDKLGVSTRTELILYAINHNCGPDAYPFSGSADPQWCEQRPIASRIGGGGASRPKSLRPATEAGEKGESERRI